MFRSAALAVLALALSAIPAQAQIAIPDDPAIFEGPVAFDVEVRAEARPAALVPLYAMQGVLHGLDVYSTFRAVDRGSGREANPLFANRGPAFMIGTKATAVVAQVFAVEKLRRKHPKLAVGVMIATNALLGGVVANNFRIGS